jgi:hypothetical protein
MSIEQALLSFTLAAGLLTITPGLDTALVLRTAAVEGGKQAMLAGTGICFGCLLWGVAASLGLSALLAVPDSLTTRCGSLALSILVIWESDCLFAHLRSLLGTGLSNRSWIRPQTVRRG